MCIGHLCNPPPKKNKHFSCFFLTLAKIRRPFWKRCLFAPSLHKEPAPLRVLAPSAAALTSLWSYFLKNKLITLFDVLALDEIKGPLFDEMELLDGKFVELLLHFPDLRLLDLLQR